LKRGETGDLGRVNDADGDPGRDKEPEKGKGGSCEDEGDGSLGGCSSAKKAQGTSVDEFQVDSISTGVVGEDMGELNASDSKGRSVGALFESISGADEVLLSKLRRYLFEPWFTMRPFCVRGLGFRFGLRLVAWSLGEEDESAGSVDNSICRLPFDSRVRLADWAHGIPRAYPRQFSISLIWGCKPRSQTDLVVADK
jgi:hypothetical protein